MDTSAAAGWQIRSLTFIECDSKLLVTHGKENTLPKNGTIEDRDLQKIIYQIINRAFKKMNIEEEVNCEGKPQKSPENSDNADSLSGPSSVQESLDGSSDTATLAHISQVPSDEQETGTKNQKEQSQHDSDHDSTSEFPSNLWSSSESSDESLTYNDEEEIARENQQELTQQLNGVHDTTTECPSDVQTSLEERNHVVASELWIPLT